MEHKGGAMPYLVCMAPVNLFAVLLANCQAYRARNIKTKYSESRYIGLIMMCLLQSWLTGIPVLGLVYKRYTKCGKPNMLSLPLLYS
jgi:hypothetical protein